MPNATLATDLARVCGGFGWLMLLMVAPSLLWGHLWGFGVVSYGLQTPLLVSSVVLFVAGLLLGMIGKARGPEASSTRWSIGPNLAGLGALLAVAAVVIGVGLALAD